MDLLLLPLGYKSMVGQSRKSFGFLECGSSSLSKSGTSIVALALLHSVSNAVDSIALGQFQIVPTDFSCSWQASCCRNLFRRKFLKPALRNFTSPHELLA